MSVMESPLVSQITDCTITLKVGTRTSKEKDDFHIDCALGSFTNLNELDSSCIKEDFSDHFRSAWKGMRE